MRLGRVLRCWRTMQEMDLRTAAKKIGVSLATLSRVERGHMPDAETLLKIVNWLMSKQPQEGQSDD